ncbi:MAG: hypothetical protein ACLQIB_51660 [Isosphaeraceae bacterium]
MPKEHAYFEWIIPALGVRYCFVTGELSFPASPPMGPWAIRYAEFTIPGLSYHRDHQSQLPTARWSLELALLIPIVLLLAIFGLCWRRLRKGRRPATPSPEPTPR